MAPPPPIARFGGDKARPAATMPQIMMLLSAKALGNAVAVDASTRNVLS